MKLTEKYELLDKIEAGNKKLYKARNLFTNEDIFIEKYIETDSSDWNEGAKINNELKNLKQADRIDDYFYVDNKNKRKRMFFKVYLENPLTSTPKRKKIVKKGRDGILEEKVLSSVNLDKVEAPPKKEKKTRNKHLMVKGLVSQKKERIIVCEVCRREISLRNFNALTNTGYCDNCKTERKVFFEEKQNQKLRAKASARLNVKKSRNRLIIEIAKNKMDIIGLLLAAIGFGIYWFPYQETLFDSLEIYLYAGVVLILIIMMLDKKYIDVTKGALRVYSKPFAITPMKKIKAKDIEQIYVKRRKSEGADFKLVTYRGRDGHRYTSERYYDAELDTYYLIAKLKEGKGEVWLLKTNNKEDALFMERTIETFLGIKDIHVNAEVEF